MNRHLRHQRGVTLLEVLITIVILVFGLLGLAGLQSRIQLAESEAYQRAQAILLVGDMVDRINANRGVAGTYAAGGTASPLGVGDAQPASCTGLPAGMARDLCEWSNELKGAAEQKSGSRVGAMIGARGCVEQIQAPSPAIGVCTPGIYRVSVAWQGLNPTKAPTLACGQGLYGDDRLQRVVSVNVIVGLLKCS